MFDVERFIENCVSAVANDDGHKAVREVVAEAVSDPGAVMNALGEPSEAGFKALYHSDALTILNFAWAPLKTLMPHNHAMWAVIGIYSGREDSIFWRRDGATIEAAGAKTLAAGDAAPLGPDVIHSVTNPIEKITTALHVYGGDFFAHGRSEWDPETLAERPFDVERAGALFEAATERSA